MVTLKAFSIEPGTLVRPAEGLVVQDPAPEADVAAPRDQDGDLGVGADLARR